MGLKDCKLFDGGVDEYGNYCRIYDCDCGEPKQEQSEVERLREDNQLLRRQNGSLTQQVIDRGQERDHLEERLAHCQRLLASGVLYKYDELLRHDAEVIERFLSTEAPRIDAGGPNPIDPHLHHCEWALHQERERLHAAANQLRQQAEEIGNEPTDCREGAE